MSERDCVCVCVRKRGIGKVSATETSKKECQCVCVGVGVCEGDWKNRHERFHKFRRRCRIVSAGVWLIFWHHFSIVTTFHSTTAWLMTTTPTTTTTTSATTTTMMKTRQPEIVTKFDQPFFGSTKSKMRAINGLLKLSNRFLKDKNNVFFNGCFWAG